MAEQDGLRIGLSRLPIANVHIPGASGAQDIAIDLTEAAESFDAGAGGSLSVHLPTGAVYLDLPLASMEGGFPGGGFSLLYQSLSGQEPWGTCYDYSAYWAASNTLALVGPGGASEYCLPASRGEVEARLGRPVPGSHIAGSFYLPILSSGYIALLQEPGHLVFALPDGTELLLGDSYDGEGRLLSASGSLTILWLGDRLLRASKGASAIDFFYGPSGGFAGFYHGASPYYYERDSLGTVLGILDASGNRKVSYRYDPWGMPDIQSDGTSAGEALAGLNPILWRGYVYDSGTGWYWLRSRFYDPRIGRFLTPDDRYGDPQKPLSLNLYAYCYDDPINYADPSGHEAIAITLGALMILFAVAGLFLVATTEPQTHFLTNTFGMLSDAIGDGLNAFGTWVSTWDFSWLDNFWNNGQMPSLYYSFPLLNIGPNIMFAKPWDVNARPGQKKQGRELNNKSRSKFTNKCKFRNGRKPLKHHTPGTDHKKYLWWIWLGSRFGWLDEDEDDEGFF